MKSWNEIWAALLVTAPLGGCGESTSNGTPDSATASQSTNGGLVASTGAPAQGGAGNSGAGNSGTGTATGGGEGGRVTTSGGGVAVGGETQSSSGLGGSGGFGGPGGLGGSGGTAGAQATASSSTHGGTGGSAGAPNQDDMLDIFDPGQVYLWGTLDEGPCGSDAITPVSEPNRAVIGFTCIFKDWDRYSPAISPRDGRLVYMGIGGGGSADEVLAFVGDGDGLGDYSTVAQANDLLQVTLCNDSSNFFVDPDDGEIVSACYGSGERAYSRAGGEPYELEQDYYLVHLGFGETALVSNAISDWAIKTETGQIIHPATELRSAYTVRARPDGFWYVTSTEGSFQRWLLGFDGSMTLEGEFPPPDPPTTLWFRGHSCALEASGALLCLASSGDDDRIVRAELGAPAAEIVYSESQSPRVKVFESGLVTGP